MSPDKLRRFIYLAICSLLFLAGCGRVAQTASPPAAEQLPTATPTEEAAIEQAPYRATPAASEIAAGICAEPMGEVVQVTIYPDIPDPRCLKVQPEQKLKVVNQAQAKLEISLGEFKAELQPGGEILWDVAFGEYLEPGVHLLGVQPCCGPEIWLQP